MRGPILFGVVEWLNGNPKLNGMKYFKTKAECCDYIKAIPDYQEFILSYTIISLYPGLDK